MNEFEFLISTATLIYWNFMYSFELDVRCHKQVYQLQACYTELSLHSVQNDLEKHSKNSSPTKMGTYWEQHGQHPASNTTNDI